MSLQIIWDIVAVLILLPLFFSPIDKFSEEEDRSYCSQALCAEVEETECAFPELYASGSLPDLPLLPYLLKTPFVTKIVKETV